MEGTGVLGENYRPTASHWQTLSHKVVSSTTGIGGIQTHNFSDDRHSLRLHSYKSNYNMIMTMTAPWSSESFNSKISIYIYIYILWTYMHMSYKVLKTVNSSTCIISIMGYITFVQEVHSNFLYNISIITSHKSVFKELVYSSPFIYHTFKATTNFDVILHINNLFTDLCDCILCKWMYGNEYFEIVISWHFLH